MSDQTFRDTGEIIQFVFGDQISVCRSKCYKKNYVS